MLGKQSISASSWFRTAKSVRARLHSVQEEEEIAIKLDDVSGNKRISGGNTYNQTVYVSGLTL